MTSQAWVSLILGTYINWKTVGGSFPHCYFGLKYTLYLTTHFSQWCWDKDVKKKCRGFWYFMRSKNFKANWIFFTVKNNKTFSDQNLTIDSLVSSRLKVLCKGFIETLQFLVILNQKTASIKIPHGYFFFSSIAQHQCVLSTSWCIFYRA